MSLFRRCTRTPFPYFLLCVASPAFAQCELDKLSSQAAGAGDQLGSAVAISTEFAIAGAMGDDELGTNAGAAHVFVRTPTGWEKSAIWFASDGAAGDAFGRSVALSGPVAVVGAYEDGDAGQASGSAYVFEEGPSGWAEATKLVPSDASSGDRFGVSVDADTVRVVVGAYRADPQGSDSGAAYVFERDVTGWSQVAKLTADDGQSGDQFGVDVAISGDLVLVGAHLEDELGTQAGAVYAYELVAGQWIQTAKLVAGAFAPGSRFGAAVALSGDVGLVGAPQADALGVDSGAAFLFRRELAGWTPAGQLLAVDGVQQDLFGSSVCIDGQHAVVGAPLDDDAGSKSGSAYVFREQGGAWIPTSKLAAVDGSQGDEFGTVVAMSKGRALISAWNDEGPGAAANAGSAYLFAVATSAAATLAADRDSISLQAGGAQALSLRACSDLGGSLYLMLGSVTGTAPGLAVDGVLLPLNWDSYLLAVLREPLEPQPLVGAMGFLDGAGEAQAQFTLPAGSDGTLAGTVLHHAYLVFEDQGSFALAVAASEAVALELQP